MPQGTGPGQPNLGGPRPPQLQPGQPHPGLRQPFPRAYNGVNLAGRPQAAPPHGQYPGLAHQNYHAQPLSGQQYGAAPGYPIYGFNQPHRTSGIAIASLVCSLLAITVGWVSWWLFFLLLFMTLVFGHSALSYINASGIGGRGLAIAGIVIGYVAMALGAVLGVIYLNLYY